MSQTPHPHDPYGTEPGTPDPAPLADQGAPTSDPALHPHDPYAYSADEAPEPAPATDPMTGGAVPDPYASPSSGPQAAPAQPAGDGTYEAPPRHGGQAPYPAPQADAPGGHEGALTGEPVSGSDSRMWAMFSQLSVVLGHVVSWGFLGWVGPLVIFLMYKDRDRFVRFHAAEALNGAIAVVIAEIVLAILIGIFGIVTLGVGWALFPLAGAPALVQLVFAIIGAVKANQGEAWKYPLNLRLVK